MYIYKTTNLINGKSYVGKCERDFDKSTNYMGSGKLINLAIKKYGIENFKKELIENVQIKELLCKKEEFYIKEFNTLIPNGYNISPIGGGGDIFTHNPRKEDIRKLHEGKKFSEESIKKRTESRKGYKHSEETKRKIGNANKGRKFPPLSKEHKEKIGKFMKGRRRSKEQIEKWKESRRGYKHSEETKRKMSESHKGIISHNKGIKGIFHHSEETRKKMSESHKNLSVETRKKMSEARKKYLLQIKIN